MAHGLTLQIDDRTEQLLRARAHQDGVTIEEEARKLLDRALRSDWESFWERVDRVQQRVGTELAEQASADRVAVVPDR